MDPNTDPGQPHGKSNPIRWDTSTAASVLVLAALAYLVFASRVLKVSASASAGVGR